MPERSIDVFRELHANRDDLVARKIISGLELSIDEGHRALETMADPRNIAMQQGRIDLARIIINSITKPPVKKDK